LLQLLVEVQHHKEEHNPPSPASAAITMMMLLCNFLTHLYACYCWIWVIGGSYAWMMPTTTTTRTTTLSSKTTTTTTSISTTSTYCITPSSSWSLATSRLYAKGESSSSEGQQQQQQQQQQRQLNWLEQWAQEGAQKIANLDIEERTQRTLFAEMAEDKIYELNLQLEELMDDETGQLKEEEDNNDSIKELAEDIALQTRSLQEQYRLLVTGEPSSMLQAMSSLKNNSNNNNNQQE
jgi:hypothetical protein